MDKDFVQFFFCVFLEKGTTYKVLPMHIYYILLYSIDIKSLISDWRISCLNCEGKVIWQRFVGLCGDVCWWVYFLAFWLVGFVVVKGLLICIFVQPFIVSCNLLGFPQPHFWNTI